MSEITQEQQSIEIPKEEEPEKNNQQVSETEETKTIPPSDEKKVVPVAPVDPVIPSKSTKDVPVDIAVKKIDKEEQSEKKGEIDEEKPAKPPSKDRITYTIKELFNINEKEGTTRKHSSLQEKYFKKYESADKKQTTRWDPEAWHKSEESRSASPQVDGWDDAYKLAPKRGSFEQGCHVKTVADVNEKLAFDKTKRLTNRAATHRTIFESSNYKDRDSISSKANEFEAHRKSQNYQSRDRAYSNDKNINMPNKKHISKFDHEKKKEYDNTPEWMSDAPMISDDFNFFNSAIEEEKKAYAEEEKRKRVKISPVIETQIFKRDRKSRTPSPRVAGTGNSKDFDLNKFMKDVEYYPPKLFQEDPAGTKSRFTQYFQFKERDVNAPNGPIIPDEVISGQSPVSPNVSHKFFAPIQPAPVLLNAAANAHAQQSSNIANIIEKTRQEKLHENLSKSKHEVRGSLSLAEIEGRVQQPSVPNGHTENQKASSDNSAFNSLLMSMKKTGQLPEKPSPIVSGLPAHLLPHPPSRTSPVFEKLKKTLSRSPSPKDFAQAVSTVASIISTHPSINQELAILKTASTSPVSVVPDEKPRTGITPAQTPKSQPISSHIHGSTGGGSSAKRPMNPFTPTSVLKKMHKGKKDDGELSNPDVSNVNIQSNGKYPDILPDQAKQHNQNTEKKNLNSQFLEAAVTPDRFKWNNDPEVSNLMPFHSAPVTPKNHYPVVSQPGIVSASAPGTPARDEINPPMVKRVTVSSLENKDAALLAPSAFKTVNGSNSSSRSDLGIIGSGLRQENTAAYNKFVDQIGKMQVGERTSPRQLPADPNLAPGNRSFDHRNIENQIQEDGSHMPPRSQSQQQKLLQNQRMAQIQQAQLLQQQKLQEIAKLGKQNTSSRSNEPPARGQHPNVNQLLPDPERNENHPMHQQGNRRSPYLQQQQQQQQQQQYLNYQQQQQQYLLNQHRAHMNQQMHPQGHPPPRLPLNHMQPQYPGMQPNQRPFNPVNFAAQALVQQQLINQAARARLIAQAQAQAQLLQQPQVVQAALMAQAALRGQAQAQAAMMLNPRNIHAMAEHMGIRQPFNPAKHGGRKQGSNASTPTAQSPELENGDDKGILSKWFSNDILQQMPTKPASENHAHSNKAKFMSVEELERGRK